MIKSSGFALLEVLIAMVIAMVGVLGVAGIQLLAINNTETARYQNIATMMASSMAVEMQANTAYWKTPQANQITVTSATTAATNCNTTVCSSTQMAQWDMYRFGQLIAGLPGINNASQQMAAKGVIDCRSNVSPLVCTITMNWGENTVALNSNGINNNEAAAIAASTLATGHNTLHQYTTIVLISQ